MNHLLILSSENEPEMAHDVGCKTQLVHAWPRSDLPVPHWVVSTSRLDVAYENYCRSCKDKQLPERSLHVYSRMTRLVCPLRQSADLVSGKMRH